MTKSTRRIATGAALTLLTSAALVPAAADARRGDDDDGRAISRFEGSGKRACAVATRRIGARSRCVRVHKHRADDDDSVYAVDVVRRGARWEVDLTARFRIVDVSRDDRDDDDDRGGDDD